MAPTSRGKGDGGQGGRRRDNPQGGKRPALGSVIEIDHGFQIISRYCGVTAKELTQGQKVKVGDVIGNLAEIPVEIVEEPHLHLEIQMEGKYVDPVAAIGRETK